MIEITIHVLDDAVFVEERRRVLGWVDAIAELRPRCNFLAPPSLGVLGERRDGDWSELGFDLWGRKGRRR